MRRFLIICTLFIALFQPQITFASLSEKTQNKINIFLSNFYSKLERKMVSEKEVFVLRKIGKRISVLQQKKVSKNKKEILEYIWKNIEIKTRNISKNTRNNSWEKLLLELDFENTILNKPVSDKWWIWEQDFSKQKTVLNNKVYLEMIVDYDKNISDYAVNKIISTKDINWEKTQALHQIIKKKQQWDTQVPLTFYTENKELENLHISYSLKYPKNLANILWKDGWAVLTEFKTTDDYRLALYVYSDKNKKLYWYMHWDNVVGDPEVYDEYWFRENKDVAVPVWEWFDVDIVWKRSTKKDWKVVWKINNQVVWEYSWITKLKDPINQVMLITNYASSPLEQWVDNLKVFKK